MLMLQIDRCIMSFGWFVGDLSAICAASALGDFTLIEEGSMSHSWKFKQMRLYDADFNAGPSKE